MKFFKFAKTVFAYLFLVSLVHNSYAESSFVSVVEKVEKSVGAIALYTPLESEAPQIMGTGFVIENGYYAVTNYHVVDKSLDPTIVQYFVLLLGKGSKVKQIKAEVVSIDPLHDLALLKLSDNVAGSLMLANDTMKKAGTDIAFTGFPIGAILGLYPATHRGYIAAITPDAIPVNNTDQLSVQMLKRLGGKQLIYQLDATAYPGNSGSPVYLPETGEVVGIINKVVVKDTKESALSSPSGISYAVPVHYINELLSKHN